MPIATLIAIFAISQSGSTVNYFGKTPEQVVKMGRDDWFDYSMKHTHQTNADMSIAEITYGEAMMKVNDKAMARLPKARHDWLLQMRKACRDYSVAAYDMGMSISIESHLWSLDRSRMGGDIEELIRDCIHPKKSSKTVSASFERDFKLLDGEIKKAKNPNLDYQPADIASAPEKRAILAKAHKNILEVLSKGRSTDKNLAYEFIHTLLEVARAKGLP